ncbi:hypothetical protein Cgig2_001085 [Carnegiea gigantea]|uniref:Uncharacterized protein n=1 Tax=Carnegiea gigantea TaxID=171969 RepID=A0A9Q1GN80_9CARY|nr:hypothetical protein Cgig2_001085 [Carnegiea gigantea]
MRQGVQKTKSTDGSNVQVYTLGFMESYELPQASLQWSRGPKETQFDDYYSQEIFNVSMRPSMHWNSNENCIAIPEAKAAQLYIQLQILMEGPFSFIWYLVQPQQSRLIVHYFHSMRRAFVNLFTHHPAQMDEDRPSVMTGDVVIAEQVQGLRQCYYLDKELGPLLAQKSGRLVPYLKQESMSRRNKVNQRRDETREGCNTRMVMSPMDDGDMCRLVTLSQRQFL